MTLEETVEYVRNNVHVQDVFEVSYNRIFAPGEVLGLTEEDEVTGEGLRVGLQLTGEVLNQAIEIDLHQIGDDLLEIRHIHDGEEIIIELI